MSYIVSLTAESAGISTALPMACRVRTYAYMPSASSLFCSTPIPNAWIPVLDGVTVPALPAPTTNPAPRPPNAVSVPADFNPADLCFLFQDLLPTGGTGTYPSVVTPDVVIPPYEEKVPIVGLIRLYMEAEPIPYDRTPTSETMTCLLSIVPAMTSSQLEYMPCVVSVLAVGVPSTSSGGGDPDFASVKILLPLSSNFTDLSSNAYTTTDRGGIAINSGVTLFSVNTAVLDGSNDFITADIGTTGAFGTGNFTIESHVSLADNSSTYTIMSWGKSLYSSDIRWALIYEGGSGELQLAFNPGGAPSYHVQSWSPSLDTFYHVAACRSSGTLRFFINGTQLGSDMTAGDSVGTLTGSLLGVGGSYDSDAPSTPTWPLIGRLANARLTTTARYTASFTAPAAPYPTS